MLIYSYCNWIVQIKLFIYNNKIHSFNQFLGDIDITITVLYAWYYEFDSKQQNEISNVGNQMNL